MEFVERMRHVKGIRLVIAEGKLDSDDYDLPLLSTSQQCPSFVSLYHIIHFRFSYPTTIWLKENLINLAAKRLPPTWKYMAWVDADLTFVNDQWVRDTIKSFCNYDVVYLWETCVNLGKDGDAQDKIDKSFGYMHTRSKYPYHQRAKYGFWHPGYAVACTRKAYEQMDGVFDYGILGSGDRHMALALIGHVEWSAPGNIHKGYLQRLREFQKRARGLRLGYVPGTIIHHWHGDKADRKYVERWDILTKGAYDPTTDLVRTGEGQLHLTTTASTRLEPQIVEYFRGRKEDGVNPK
jgi:hypothetical protein